MQLFLHTTQSTVAATGLATKAKYSVIGFKYGVLGFKNGCWKAATHIRASKSTKNFRTKANNSKMTKENYTTNLSLENFVCVKGNCYSGLAMPYDHFTPIESPNTRHSNSLTMPLKPLASLIPDIFGLIYRDNFVVWLQRIKDISAISSNQVWHSTLIAIRSSKNSQTIKKLSQQDVGSGADPGRNWCGDFY